MPTCAQYMHMIMQQLATANAAAIKRGIAVPDVSLHAIDYAHRFDSSLAHGTLSDFDGDLKITWSFDSAGGRRTDTRAIADAEFSRFWNDLIDYPVFRRNQVVEASCEVNPAEFHVISFSSIESAVPSMGVFQVPADEADAQWADWFKRLQVPGLRN